MVWRVVATKLGIQWVREIRLARKGSGAESLKGGGFSDGSRGVIWVSLWCQIMQLQYFPFLSEGKKI